MPKDKMMNSFTMDEDFVQLIYRRLPKMIKEKLDMITNDLKLEIKLKVEVSENERIELGKIQRKTSFIENFIQKVDQMQNNQQCKLITMTTTSTSTNCTTDSNENTEPVNVAFEKARTKYKRCRKNNDTYSFTTKI